MTISQEDIKRVKGLGFLHNRGTDNFSGRIITENGIINSRQLAIISQAAEKFAAGDIAFTSRMTIEVPGIAYDKIEAFRRFIAQENLQTGGTGAKVRPIVACKGTTCVFGLYDTQKLAQEIHQRFFVGYQDIKLPHKFKIGIGGCPNNCIKADLNDLGIIGQKKIILKTDLCRSCKKCQVIAACPIQANYLQDNKIAIHNNICNNCGRCLNQCPFGAIEDSPTLYKIFLGGRWGKQIRIGTALETLFSQEELLNMIEKAILLFKSQGLDGERFSSTIERIGLPETEKLLLSDQLLNDKEQILQK